MRLYYYQTPLTKIKHCDKLADTSSYMYDDQNHPQACLHTASYMSQGVKPTLPSVSRQPHVQLYTCTFYLYNQLFCLCIQKFRIQLLNRQRFADKLGSCKLIHDHKAKDGIQ